MRGALGLVFVAALLGGCSGSDRPPDAGPEDAATTDAAEPDGGPGWPAALPSAGALPPVRGRSIARTVVHLHSPLSHDACDGSGWIDGELADPDCLARLRAAMCALHLDAAMLTDHAPHLEEVSLRTALLLADGDEAVLGPDGQAIANRMACPDGHRVLITAGSENALMPLSLSTHPADPSDPDALRAVYDADGPEAVQAFQAAGALVWQAHTEGRDLATLSALGLDGLEIYNLHANVDPGIREQHLGLEPLSYTPQLLEFANRRLGLPPDLALLSFLSENGNALAKWDALLAGGTRVTGTGGCDAHENALPMLLTDGERADSYRRMMFWIQNHLRVDEVSPAGIRDALAQGRLYVVFEVLGTPIGFDFAAEAGSDTFEMGQQAPLGATLRVAPARLPDDWPADPPPQVTVRLLRAQAEGAVEVARSGGEAITHEAVEPGAYRVEVWMLPEHARPFLGDRADALIREVPWIYSNPIFVGPG